MPRTSKAVEVSYAAIDTVSLPRATTSDDAAHPAAHRGIGITAEVGGYVDFEGPVILLHSVPDLDDLRLGILPFGVELM